MCPSLQEDLGLNDFTFLLPVHSCSWRVDLFIQDPTLELVVLCGIYLKLQLILYFLICLQSAANNKKQQFQSYPGWTLEVHFSMPQRQYTLKDSSRKKQLVPQPYVPT